MYILTVTLNKATRCISIVRRAILFTLIISKSLMRTTRKDIFWNKNIDGDMRGYFVQHLRSRYDNSKGVERRSINSFYTREQQITQVMFLEHQFLLWLIYPKNILWNSTVVK